MMSTTKYDKIENNIDGNRYYFLTIIWRDTMAENIYKCNNCNQNIRTKYAIKFCSKSCSATFNNKARTSRSSESRLRTSASMKNKPGIKGSRNKYSKVTFKKCIVCNNSFYHRGHHLGRKTCSRKCHIISATSNRNYQNGSRKPTWFYSSYQSKMVLLESSWEVRVATELDSLNLVWSRPEPISWIDNSNKNRLYYPDFYLPEYDIFLDPKNPYCMKLDTEKLGKVTKTINLIYGDIQIILEFIRSLKKAEN